MNSITAKLSNPSVVQEIDNIVNWLGEGLNGKSKPLNFAGDPFAASVTSWRFWKAGGPRWSELEQCRPNDADRILAQEMCSYYRDKIGMRALKGQPMTNFQKDLYDILVNELTVLREEHRGMIHRLPYFYEEDMERKQLFDRFKNSIRPNQLQQIDMRHVYRDITLTPYKRLLVSRRSNEIVEYWFEDTVGQPVLFKMTHNAALRKMFDGIFSQPSVKLKGYTKLGQLREAGFPHWWITEPELVFN